MRFLWWEWQDQLAGLLVAIAALPVIAAATAPGPEVGLGAGRLREGMSSDEAEARFGQKGEVVSFGFSSSGCGRPLPGEFGPPSPPPRMWARYEARYRYRGPLTAVDGTFRGGSDVRSNGMEEVRVRPALLALSDEWLAAVAAAGLCAAEVARRTRAARRCP